MSTSTHVQRIGTCRSTVAALIVAAAFGLVAAGASPVAFGLTGTPGIIAMPGGCGIPGC